jgi:polysaccharide biosynthesis protein PslH
MRILYITPCWPHGPSYGGQLRALHIGRALAELGDVTIAVVSSDLPSDKALQETKAEFDLHGQVRVETRPNRRLGQRARWFLDSRYMNVHGCVAHEQDRAKLLARLPEFDLVWVLNSRTPNILQHWHWPNAVLDLDDIPSTFHRSVQQTAGHPLQAFKAGLHARLSCRRERHWKERFKTLTVCSETDRQYLGGGPNIHVIPNGFARPDREPVPAPVDPQRIGFIGLFNYPPNLEGVRWFVRECWPLIKRALPNARLRLVGKETDGPLKPEGPDIDGLGWVADSAAEIATWSAMIIPVRNGAGTRIKIAEAFSRKCPVVSTRLGAYGYDVAEGRELRLADQPADFADACISLMANPQHGKEMAETAWSRFLENWTWEAIAPRVHAAARQCAGSVADSGSPAEIVSP